MPQSSFWRCVTLAGRKNPYRLSVAPLTWLLAFLLAPLTLAETIFTSSTQQVQLVELYTSEGCSSCPPADRWLSRWRTHPDLWNKVIPLGFHVDYWDYIGWPDRFAEKRFSQRQRKHHRQGNIRQVYTPGFVVAGKEWRGWYARRGLPESGLQPGQLQLAINAAKFSAHFTGETKVDQLTIALVGAGLTTAVKAGENRGELLQHDFVVLALQEYQGGDSWQGLLPQKADPNIQPEQVGIAAWVTRGVSLIPVQAVGGWLE